MHLTRPSTSRMPCGRRSRFERMTEKCKCQGRRAKPEAYCSRPTHREPPMTRRRVLASTLVAALTIAGLTAARTIDPHAGRASEGTYGMRLAPLQLRSIGVMTFGPDGILYVADSRAGAVYAIDLGDAGRDTSSTGIKVDGVDSKIAS